jgi:hypothetical protein|tara:strand:- start:783 stop:1301 length:519 start_codon:yes stop_codon:yes gene_type:complete
MIRTHGYNGVAILKENKMNDPIYLTGKCHYASLVEPNTKFDPVWTIQIEVNDENRSAIEGANLPITNKGDDRGDFVIIKRKVFRKDGSERQAPIVKDSQNNPWNNKLIGNGSLVNVKAIPYEWNYAGKTGISADLAAVQVVDFIEYTPSREDFDPVDGGYVTDSAIPTPAFS